MFSIDEMVVKGLARRSGFPVRVGASKGNLFTGQFRLEDFVISNPAGFPLDEFVSVEEARARISPSSLMSKKIQVRELRVHLRQLTGVRSKSGAINIEQFREALERRDSSDSREPGGSSREVFIEHLVVKVDHIATVDFADLDHGRRDYPLHFEREYKNVNNLLSLAPPLVEHCGTAGLWRATNAIFATLLPELLWRRIAALG